METEEERVRRIIEEMAKGTDMGHKLKYDRVRKRVRPVSDFHDPDDDIEITPDDADLFYTIERIIK